MGLDLSLNSMIALGGAMLAAMVALFFYVRNFRTALMFLGGMLFFSNLGVHVHSWTHARNFTWIAPLQEARSEITTGLAALLLVGMFAHMRQLSFRPVSQQGVVYLIMVLYAGLLRMGHDNALSGLISMVQGVLLLVPLLLVVPNLVRTWQDFDAVFRTILYTMLVWSAVTFVQVFIDREQLFSSSGGHWGYRFTGLTPNPQTAGLLLSLTGGVGLWLIMNGSRGFSRLMAVAVTGSILVMLLWTGSRTGVVMFLMMACSVFYSRMGRAILILPVLSIVTYGLWWYATSSLDVDVGLTRLVSSTDTRSEAWGAMWRTGTENFIFGVGADDSPASENSLLFGFASYGIGMVVLILVLTGVTAMQVFRLAGVRGSLEPAQKRVVDLLIGFHITYIAGAVAEGYMLGRVNLVTVLLFIFGGMSARVIGDVQRVRHTTPAPHVYEEFEGVYGEA